MFVSNFFVCAVCTASLSRIVVAIVMNFGGEVQGDACVKLIRAQTSHRGVRGGTPQVFVRS